MAKGTCPACGRKEIYSRGVVQTERCASCHSVFYRGILLGKEPEEGYFDIEIISAGVLVMHGRDIDQAMTDRLRGELAKQPHFVDPYGIEAARQPLVDAQAWWGHLSDDQKVEVHRALRRNEGKP